MRVRSAAIVLLLVSVAAAEPRPPAKSEQLAKTPINDIAKHAAKKSIRALEDLVYSMEKDTSTIWNYLNGGSMSVAELRRVDEQIAKLETALAEIKRADPGWHRIAEYERRLNHLKAAAAEGRGQRDAAIAADTKAKDDAARAADAAWQAKRVKDDGIATELHRANVGKVVFAASDIDGKAAPVTKVAVDAPLFGRGFFAESPWNALHTAKVDCGEAAANLQKFTIESRFKVNGGEWMKFGSIGMEPAAFKTQTSVAVSKHGSLTAGGTFKPGDDEWRGTFRWITSVAPELVVGDNTVTFEMAAWCYGAPSEVTIASSTLTVTATKAQLVALAKRIAVPLYPSVHSAAALAPYKPKLQKMYADRGYEILDVRTASEWKPVRHPVSGVIIAREATAAIHHRTKGTIKCGLLSLVLSEPYDGKKYGPALDVHSTTNRPFACPK